MDGMKCKDQRSPESDSFVTEYALAQPEYQPHDQAVQKQVHQVKAEGIGLKQLVAEDVPQRHQRPVIVCVALAALERPNRRSEDFSDVAEAVRIRIVFDLLVVI